MLHQALIVEWYIRNMKTHHGSCHCGAVSYETQGEFGKVMECDCSHCSRKGFLLSFIPTEDFKLLSGEDNLTEYRFNKKQIQHLFCKTCGVESFAYGQNKEGKKTAMINARCLEDVDPSTLEVTKFEGKKY